MASVEDLGLHSWEKGGPNDPTVVFQNLRDTLYLVKEELSPWSWRAYAADFFEKREQERKLRALNKLPGSGLEPSDGVVERTPMWQERLDKMLLVEHLKRRLMTAHHYFCDAAELMLQSHHWLVKNGLLADTFVTYITKVPTAMSDRMDLVQDALRETRNSLKQSRQEFEDYKMMLAKQRNVYLDKTLANQEVRLKFRRCEDVVLAWSYGTMRQQVLKLKENRAIMETRVDDLEAELASTMEDFDDSRRAWAVEKAELTKDRDKFMKLYKKMVAAHEQAMADLKRVEGTAEGQAAELRILAVAKATLEQQVAELEDDKRRMEKMLAAARNEVNMLKVEIRRLGGCMHGTETLLDAARAEVNQLEGIRNALEASLDEAVTKQTRLRDDLVVAQVEVDACRQRQEDVEEELTVERKLRDGAESERDYLLDLARGIEAELVSTVKQSRAEVIATREKFERDLHEFKTRELDKIKKDFLSKTDRIIARNQILERECALGDSIAPSLSVLKPLVKGDQKLCNFCRKIVIFDGQVER